MTDWSTLRERVEGKWQIPLLVLSLAMLGGAFLRMRPAATQIPLEDSLKYLDTLIAGGLSERALSLGNTLLASEELDAAERAPIHVRMARASFERADQERARTAEAGHAVVEHYDKATVHGSALTAEDHRKLGESHEWQGQFAQAVAHYDQALAGGVEGGSDLRQRQWLLKERLGAEPEELSELLDSFLTSVEDHRLDLRFWAIDQEMGLLGEMERLDEVATLLARHADRFRDSDMKEEFSFLEALALYREGHFDEAEAYLRSIRNRVGTDDEVHAKTGWLLGRVVLDDGGPQRPYEAISFFTDVITHHAGHPYAVASRLGVGEALATLERHDQALEAFRTAIEELAALRSGAPRGLMNRDVLRVSLGMMSQRQLAGGDLGAALAYAGLAAELVDPDNAEQRAAILLQLGQAQQLRAEELARDAGVAATDGQEDAVVSATDLTERSGALFATAAETFVTVSQIHTLNEWRSAESSWRAAELFTRAGQLGRAVKLFRAFAQERPDHSLVPRALLRIGQLHQAMGDLPSAIEAYKQCYRDYPRTLDGSRALIPLARCYLALGLDKDPLAQKTLHLVLEDSDVFTPEAPEFADALFLMGEVLNRRGDYEQAIGTLEEALDRYPDDPRAWQARPLLADSYRQSGLVLKKEVADATTAAEIGHIREESVERFHKARELYRMLITQNEVRGNDVLEWIEELNLRHAYAYEADCYYEVGDYREALRHYEEVAGMFKDTPTALAAYVQIINCHAFLGQSDEARAALARARILVGAISQEAFDRGVSPEGRKDWERYFESLGDAELF